MRSALQWWPLLALPAASVAAQATMALDAGTPRFWWALGAVLLVSVVGYACSSLYVWAGWRDDTGGAVAVLERRLRIVQGLMVALLAGCLAYYGGFYYFKWAEIACFGCAALAAFGGDKFITPLVARVVEMYRAAFGGGSRGA